MPSKTRSVIIIPTWNRLDLLKQILSALKNQNDKSFGILVVDNGSSDGTRDFLIKKSQESFQENIPLCSLLLNNNRGFALANNLAFSFAFEFLKPEYFFILNNDTLPDPDFIGKLCDKANHYLEKDPEIDKKGFPCLAHKKEWRVGSFAPLIENYFNRGMTDSAGVKVYPDGSAINRGMGIPVSKYTSDEEVFGPSGAAAMYLSETLRDIALPVQYIASLQPLIADQKESRVWRVTVSRKKPSGKGILLPVKEILASRYFAYFEDVDLCFRMRLRSWGTVFAPQAKILHYHSATGKLFSPFKSYHIHRNQYFNLVRDFPGRFLWEGILKAFKRYFYLLRALREKRGAVTALAKNTGKFRTFGITILGWFDLIYNLPCLIRERNYIQNARKIDPEEFNYLFSHRRFRASLRKMIFATPSILKAQKSNGAKDKDHVGKYF